MVAYYEQAKNYFTDFEQVKRKTNRKTPVGETGCLRIAFFAQPPYHPSLSRGLSPGF